MDRGAWRAKIRSCKELDVTEATYHAHTLQDIFYNFLCCTVNPYCLHSLCIYVY